MALVGDVLFSVRQKIPDLPPSFPAPVITALSPSPGTALPPGTWFFVATILTQTGETLPSNEQSIVVTPGNGNINVNLFFVGNPANIVGVRVYIGNFSGAENQYQQFSGVTILTGNYFVTLTAVYSTPGFPPDRSTAYLMDFDGQIFGASTLYLWLNEGLAEFSRICGGLLDYCGVPTVTGNPMYVLPGQWPEITDIWYGGYWIRGGKRMDFWRRNNVVSDVLSNVTVSVHTNQQVLEVWPQPDRTSGVSATTAAMAATDTAVPIANPGIFLLPFGFAQLGTGAGAEIVAYSNVSMSGMIRGLGSSVAQAWPSGTTVTELSLFWCGKRLFGTKYIPGDSAIPLQAPSGWAAILPLYMLAQAKKAEQEMSEGEKLEEQFYKAVQAWFLSNKGVVRQVQVGGTGAPLTFDNTVGGGIIIPGP